MKKLLNIFKKKKKEVIEDDFNAFDVSHLKKGNRNKIKIEVIDNSYMSMGIHEVSEDVAIVLVSKKIAKLCQ